MQTNNPIYRFGTWLGTPLMRGAEFIERNVFENICSKWGSRIGGAIGNRFMNFYLNLQPLSDITLITPKRKVIIDINCFMLGVGLCFFGFAFYLNTLP